MLNSFDIFIHNLHGPLPMTAVRANALNGMFYAEMGKSNGGWVERMHAAGQNGTPLPFSLSLLFEDGFVKGFRVGALDAETGDRAASVWGSLAARQSEVRLGPAQVIVTAVRPGQPHSATYEELYEQVPVATGVRLAFVSPLRIKVMGHETVLPVPRQVWDFYTRRWEAYSGIVLPPDFSRWVDRQVLAVELQLSTVFAYVEKENEWKGVTGEVEYRAFQDSRDLPDSRQPEYLRAWQALALMAEFSGTGEK